MPQRIISLVPSISELLYALGLEENVAGITKFCVHPPHWQKTKTMIGGTKNIYIEKIQALQPDLIIASKEENVKAQVEPLSLQFPVWLTDVHNLDTALTMIQDIGRLTQTIHKAEILVQAIGEAFAQLQPVAPPVNTCYLIWRQPYMTVGGDTYISNMLQHCGLHNVFACKTRYPTIELERLKETNCRLLLLSTEPYPFTEKHIRELQAYLPTVHIMLVDGEMFSWYGSRLVAAAAYFIQFTRLVKALPLS